MKTAVATELIICDGESPTVATGQRGRRVAGHRGGIRQETKCRVDKPYAMITWPSISYGDAAKQEIRKP
jgi:hypothetical protein